MTSLKLVKQQRIKKETNGKNAYSPLNLHAFSKRTPNEILPNNIKGKKVKLVRFCSFDWHYKLGVKKTLDFDETEAVLAGKQSETIYW